MQGDALWGNVSSEQEPHRHSWGDPGLLHFYKSRFVCTHFRRENINNHCGTPGMSPASLTNNLQERPELSMDSPHGSLHLPFGMSSTSTITKQFHCAPQKYLSMFLLQHMRTLNLSITKSSEKMKLCAKISPLLKNDEISCHLINSDMAGSC